MLQVVWFKRDLRIDDHAPLTEAARRGPVLPLYIAEPELWAQPDMAGRHWAFIAEALHELRRDLAQRGQPLVVRCGRVVDVLAELRQVHGALALWSHEETGQAWTYARDLEVSEWCRAVGVPWRELPQNGVVRRLRSRNGWAARWQTRMSEALHVPPRRLPALSGVAAGPIPDSGALGLASDACPGRQAGGSKAGRDLIDSFLSGRGWRYHQQLSSPLSAEHGCSRISAHLAWGTISLRQVHQMTMAAWDRLDPLDPEQRVARRALKAFDGRLHWHCHFMQKLESEPRLEFGNAHPAYDGLREAEWNPAHFEAWCTGMTGLPFVDACMRALRATGWINFRMRAMLTAVSSYHLWLHWREPALFLARQFTDYEPGIHYNQVQMQSGTTGINTVRIYNPVKQGLDHDADGDFVRRWVPELQALPRHHVHQPWTLSKTDLRRFGASAYPDPVVEPLAAARIARDRVWAVRKGSEYARVADGIQSRHGSRRAGLPGGDRRVRKGPDTGVDSGQLALGFDEPP
jgi:deoxyribodipyrimidine photo-lyase